MNPKIKAPKDENFYDSFGHVLHVGDTVVYCNTASAISFDVTSEIKEWHGKLFYEHVPNRLIELQQGTRTPFLGKTNRIRKLEKMATHDVIGKETDDERD